MISLFRNFARSKWAVGLLVLVGFAVVFTGAQMDVFSNLGPKHVVSAGSRSVDQAQFRQEFERVRTAAAEQEGRAVSTEDLVKANQHIAYLDMTTRRLGLLEWAWDAGIRPGKDLIIKQIRALPAFFNQVSGKFDEDQYRNLLAQQNVTPAQLEQEFRDQEIISHFGSGVTAGVRLPRIYGALMAAGAMQTRDGRWFEVTSSMVPAVGAPTDAQLTAFMNENAAQLRRPEFRMASVVLFSDGAASTAPIAEERIVERFNFKKDTLSKPETRTFVTLTAPTKAAADRIAAALRAGQTPAAAGQANGGVQPADFNATPRSAVTDPAVAAAVFAATPGQVIDPIQGRVGFTVARLTSVTPGAAATLESARPALIAELREEDAKAKVFSRVEQYEKARNEGKTLDQAIAQIGARIIKLPPFTADGKLPDGQPMNAPPQILQAATTLSKGGESDVIDAGQGQYFVLRLDDIMPAAMPTLAEVRAPLAQEWTRRENARRLSAKAEELAAQVRGGKDIAAVAASAGATLVTRTAVSQTPDAQNAIGQGVLRGLFGQGRGQVFSGQTAADAFVVGRVDAIHAASPVLAAAPAEQVRLRLAPQIGNALAEQLATAAMAKVKATNDPVIALQALGVTAPDAPTTPAP
ncbi:peptidyl-prolyl cis-trans isomerase [Brevundimonas sp.]|uniref:peptidyl-prolyl cis-trans isomerase n=3 Tax=Brevundimonas sp. TaxID=1871086 RepID=UPI0040340A01